MTDEFRPADNGATPDRRSQSCGEGPPPEYDANADSYRSWKVGIGAMRNRHAAAQLYLFPRPKPTSRLAEVERFGQADARCGLPLANAYSDKLREFGWTEHVAAYERGYRSLAATETPQLQKTTK